MTSPKLYPIMDPEKYDLATIQHEQYLKYKADQEKEKPTHENHTKEIYTENHGQDRAHHH